MVAAATRRHAPPRDPRALRLVLSERPLATRNVGLDALRTAAIVMVVLFHYPKGDDQVWLRALTHYGWTGVDLFFVLSGYLIAGQYFARGGAGRQQAALFYLRRLLRTLPNYLVMIAVVFTAESAWSWARAAQYGFFLQNFASPTVFTTSWSLCVEEHFYLLFAPAVALLRSAAAGRRRPAAVVVAAFLAVLVGGMLLRASLWWRLRPDQMLDPDQAYAVYLGRLFYPTPMRLDGLLLGVGLAALRCHRPRHWERLVAKPQRLLAGGIGLLILAFASLYMRMSFAAVVFGFPLLAAGYGCLVAAAACDRGPLAKAPASLVQPVAILSYAIYLTHNLALEAAFSLVRGWGLNSQGLVTGLFSIILVGVFSIALYWCVERPFLQLRDRFGRSRTA